MTRSKTSCDRPLEERVGPDPRGRRELTLAARRFRARAGDEPLLARLVLVDPVRAFGEVGIEVSRRARKEMRRLHPELAIGNDDLYERVRRGEALRGIRSVDLGGDGEGGER